MSSVYEFLHICLYGVVFVIAVIVMIVFLNITDATQHTVSTEITQNASIDERMTIYRDTEQKYTTIVGTNILTDILSIIEPLNEKQIADEIVKIKIESYDITKEDLIDVKNNKKEGITLVKSKISTDAEYRRVYHYDEDYNITEVNYVKE